MDPELIGAIAVFITANVAFLTLVWKVVENRLNKLDTKIDASRADQRVIKKEVQNSHSINLRDDMDEKHQEQMLLLEKLSRHVMQIDKTTAEDRAYNRQEANNIWSQIDKIKESSRRGVWNRKR